MRGRASTGGGWGWERRRGGGGAASRPARACELVGEPLAYARGSLLPSAAATGTPPREPSAAQRAPPRAIGSTAGTPASHRQHGGHPREPSAARRAPPRAIGSTAGPPASHRQHSGHHPRAFGCCGRRPHRTASVSERFAQAPPGTRSPRSGATARLPRPIGGCEHPSRLPPDLPHLRHLAPRRRSRIHAARSLPLSLRPRACAQSPMAGRCVADDGRRPEGALRERTARRPRSHRRGLRVPRLEPARAERADEPCARGARHRGSARACGDDAQSVEHASTQGRGKRWGGGAGLGATREHSVPLGAGRGGGRRELRGGLAVRGCGAASRPARTCELVGEPLADARGSLLPSAAPTCTPNREPSACQRAPTREPSVAAAVGRTEPRA